jgi:Tol biopolymer transport system component
MRHRLSFVEKHLTMEKSMKSFIVFLTVFFIAATAAFPALAVDTNYYGTALAIIHPEIPPNYHGGPYVAFSDPVWSPDGKTIGFLGNGAAHIFTVPSSGGELTAIYNNFGKKKGYPLAPDSTGIGGGMVTLGYTPDGKEIIFRDDMVDRARGTYVGPYDLPTGQHSDFAVLYPVLIIQSVDITTGAVRTLVEEAQDGAMSPDGRYIAYTWVSWANRAVTGKAETGLKILDLTTGENRMLDPGGYAPCFTPDSKYVVYSTVNVNSTNIMQSSIMLNRIPVSGGNPEQITYTTLEQPIPGIYYPQVSPDGEWILFFYRTSPQHTIVYRHLCVFNTRTKEAFEFFPETDKSIESAQWSPDGKKIAYTLKSFYDAYGNRDVKTTIYILDFPTASVMKRLQTAVTEVAPVGFALTGNYPNPFNPSTAISFTLPASGPVSLAVYDITGRKVRDLVSGPLSAGMHSVAWDGRDASGKAVSSGVYLSRLVQGKNTISRRMLLMK